MPYYKHFLNQHNFFIEVAKVFLDCFCGSDNFQNGGG